MTTCGNFSFNSLVALFTFAILVFRIFKSARRVLLYKQEISVIKEFSISNSLKFTQCFNDEIFEIAVSFIKSNSNEVHVDTTEILETFVPVIINRFNSVFPFNGLKSEIGVHSRNKSFNFVQFFKKRIFLTLVNDIYTS